VIVNGRTDARVNERLGRSAPKFRQRNGSACSDLSKAQAAAEARERVSRHRYLVNNLGVSRQNRSKEITDAVGLRSSKQTL